MPGIMEHPFCYKVEKICLFQAYSKFEVLQNPQMYLDCLESYNAC